MRWLLRGSLCVWLHNRNTFPDMHIISLEVSVFGIMPFELNTLPGGLIANEWLCSPCRIYCSVVPGFSDPVMCIVLGEVVILHRPVLKEFNALSSPLSCHVNALPCHLIALPST